MVLIKKSVVSFLYGVKKSVLLGLRDNMAKFDFHIVARARDHVNWSPPVEVGGTFCSNKESFTF